MERIIGFDPNELLLTFRTPNDCEKSHENPFLTVWVILGTDQQTNRQTGRHRRSHYVFPSTQVITGHVFITLSTKPS